MRYSITAKFIAILLTAVALVAAFAGVLGIVQVAELGLYSDGFDGWVQNRLEWQAYDLSKDLTERYAVRELTNCPDELLEELGYWYIFEASIHWTGLDESSYDYVISDPSGNVLANGKGLPKDKEGFAYQTGCSIQYPVLVTDEETINEQYGKEYVRRQTINADIYGDKPVIIRYYESPVYRVNISLDADAVISRSGTSLELVKLVYQQRYNLMFILAAASILAAAGFVYLCCAAGKKHQKDKAVPGALNSLPLDLYAAAGGLISYFLGSLAVQMINYWIFGMDNLNPGTLVLVGMVLLLIAVICVGFLFALCAQIKTKGLFWWKRSVLCWLWGRVCVVAGYVWLGVKTLFSLLPTIWHFVLIGGAMGLSLILLTALALDGIIAPLIVTVCLFVVGLVYSGCAYGMILQGAERMAKGNLDTKIDTRFLIGTHRKCAENINSLADTAILAAKKQMRADRMKTELITNVTHDIKTPLTSIINYVDLLHSIPGEQEQQQYLEVLSRQSQRLKKLIDDLMEMSKATTGNMTVDIIDMDPVETVVQALGEFSDKLEKQDLTVVFQPPETVSRIKADGRLTWRVLSNLLSNIVKYALPGTRVYADVSELDEYVLISFKNISKEPLNIPADELTERFVRGDESRNTEGSGLGLNIAKSLMELQKGKLQLLVDGDLFKATLVFPQKR